ncbi:DUF975 family protein [Clostridium boliviensis]|uniref:DUF975 family protein n=1 Tax=Clostridium boliviensis TaxID=318465 RepID=A0ABU4GMZ8_9CLOT|nr:DUF975 family protein [Clostridium boliviensis]MDW2799001.1 DUF975 family protein [Clostridium boliviensis]
MKISSKELKKRAKQKLMGNYGLCVGAQLIVGAIMSVILIMVFFAVLVSAFISTGLIPGAGVHMKEFTMILIVVGIVSILMLIIVSLFTPGMFKIFLNISGDRPAKLSDLLYGFKNKPHKFIGLNFIIFLMMMIWAIPYYVVLAVAAVTNYIPVMVVLLIITYLLLLAGIMVTSLYVSQSMFIFVEAPEKGVFQCIRESAELMNGNKGSLFYLNLSFIGLVLLGYFSFGIAYLWIYPYMYATYTEYYKELKQEF